MEAAHAHTSTPTPTRGTEADRLKEAQNLYDNEASSDVTFIVGNETCQARMPAHIWVLSSRNPVFRAMFDPSWTDRHKKVYNIRNDPKGFQNLLMWLYLQKCSLQSLGSALVTLHVAIQYLCPELADLCANYILQHLNASNVLRVMQQIHSYCSASHGTIPSAPSLEVLEGRSQEALSTMAHDIGDETDLRDPTSCCSDLFNECLEILDHDTSLVLASEGLEELDCSVLEVVLRRDSLDVRGEEVVVEAVVRWSTAQCKRRNLPLTSQNRRQVLGDLLYFLRLLKLTPEQLSVASKLLNKDEFEYIRAVVSGRTRKSISPPPTLAPYLKLMATARGPLPSSSAAPQPPPDNGKKKCGNKKKYTKKELILDIVSCLAVIFD